MILDKWLENKMIFNLNDIEVDKSKRSNIKLDEKALRSIGGFRGWSLRDVTKKHKLNAEIVRLGGKCVA